LFIGSATGFLAGLLGIGGGLIIVPLLTFYFHYMGFPHETLMHVVIGTSLASMVTTTCFSAKVHTKVHPEVLKFFKKMATFVFVGSVSGALLANVLYSDHLKMAFGIFAIGVALFIFFDPQFKNREHPPHMGTLHFGSFVIGFTSAIFGIGGGSIGLPFLTNYLNMEMHRAVGVAALLSVLVSFVGTIAYITTGSFQTVLPPDTSGYVYWPAVIGMNLTSPFFAYFGARVEERISVNFLKQIFAVILLGMGLKMIF